MGLKLTKLHDPDKTYIVRVCMLAGAEDVIYPGSVHRECEECGKTVWYDPNQVIPDPGMPTEGEVVLCLPCCALHAVEDDEPVTWLGSPGSDLT